MAKTSPDISFDDITLYAGKGVAKKVILNKISGNFPSGKLVGILGPSGAGKTSLLNVLSGWNTENTNAGKIKLNDGRLELKKFKNISCYITQDSYLNEILTVEENMTFTADLKLGRQVAQTTKDTLITDILSYFGLTESRHTMTSKLSGGQRKRLAICLELLNDPDVIFLDEPTTGLDIVSMFQCMKHLKDLTRKGNSVICTLHQPPDQIFELFDIVYIVGHGKCAYQGGPKELITFLDDSGVPCELFHSPLDFLIEIANGDYGPKALNAVLCTSQNGKNKDYMPIIAKKSEDNKPKVFKKRKTLMSFRKHKIKDSLYEFYTLLRRESLKINRDYFFMHFRVLSVLFNSVLSGILCYNMGSNAEMHYFNYNIVLMHIAATSLSSSLFSNVSFTLNQNLIKNEYRNKYYSICNYFMVNLILDTPVVFLATASSSFAVYWLSGQLLSWNRVLMFICISFETGMIASSMGFLFGTILDFNKSIFLVTSIHIPILAVSGFGISIYDIPSYFSFASSIAYTRYTTRGLMDIVFGYNRPMMDCPEEKIYCHFRDTKKFLNDMGLEDFYFVYDACALIGFFIFLRLSAYWCIRLRLKGVL